MKSGFLHFRESIIHFRKGGIGKKVLLCFHGYGESATHFDFLLNDLEDEYLILALDLPFHGQTNWKEKEFTPEILLELVYQILMVEGRDNAEIHLLGFSLGGRIALCLLTPMQKKVGKIILLAPDGFKLNFWFWLATQTAAGNSLFRLTMEKPEWFMGFLKIGNRMRLINQSIYKFVFQFIDDRQVRKDLYDRWTGTRKFVPDLREVSSIINANKIPLKLLYGKYDRIILPSPAERFTQKLSSPFELKVIRSGHQVLDPRNTVEILKIIRD